MFEAWEQVLGSDHGEGNEAIDKVKMCKRKDM
jgi:hypothetical protein